MTCLVGLVFAEPHAPTTAVYKPRAVEPSAEMAVRQLGGKVMYDLGNRVVVAHINGCLLTDADLARLQKTRYLPDWPGQVL